jgi:hypothetical protein
MIWATVGEVRNYLDDSEIPEGVSDEQLQAMIDRCARTLTTKVIRWPVLDEGTQRAEDVEQRGHIVAAVAECVKARYAAKTLAQQLGGDAVVELIAAGGSVKAQSLAVAGGSSNTRGAKIGQAADRVPIEAIEALLAANLIGGGGVTW